MLIFLQQYKTCFIVQEYTLADSGFFKDFQYQGGVKSTGAFEQLKFKVSGVFEDLKFKISEGQDQN